MTSQVLAEQKKKIITTTIITILLWVVFLLFFIYIGFDGTQPYLVASFLFNGGLFYAMMILALRKRAFSIDLMHAFFLFTFMFFAPFVQYLQNAWCWGTSFSNERILITNLLLDVWVVIYYFAKNLRLRPYKKKEMLKRRERAKGTGILDIKVNRTFLLICVLISDVIAAILFLRHGTSLFSRGTNTAFTYANKTLTLIVSSAIPAFITGTTALAVLNLRPHGRPFDWALLFMQTGALFIACFPLGMARYKMAVIYVGLALILCPFFRKGSWFVLMMVFGLVIIFPLMDAFRRVSFLEVDVVATLQSIATSFVSDLTQGHYDAYTMFMLIQEYVAQTGLSLGGQLLGVLLFFVPRTIWPSKALGSGQTAAEFFQWSFTNLSCPLPAEGYINFGIVGVILFAFILAKVGKWLDDTYWKGRSQVVKVVYPFVVPFIFFLMRGDLLSSFSYLLGFSITVAFVYFLNNALNGIKIRSNSAVRSANGNREQKSGMAKENKE